MAAATFGRDLMICAHKAAGGFVRMRCSSPYPDDREFVSAPVTGNHVSV
jgi:hypothetical protein